MGANASSKTTTRDKCGKLASLLLDLVGGIRNLTSMVVFFHWLFLFCLGLKQLSFFWFNCFGINVQTWNCKT